MSVEAINAKKVVVEEITGKFNDSQSAVVVEYRGLSVAEVTELRKALREEDVEFKVYKNKLVQRATESAGYAEINDKLVGPNAIAFGHSDAVAPARVLANFAKDHEALVIKAIDEAVLKLIETREEEGRRLQVDLISKLDGMIENVKFITEKSPVIVAEYKEKITNKIHELLEDSQIDESRIAQEVTVFADKVCVDEELVRLDSHIKAMREDLLKGGTVGRRLDFIAQEMNREANTILSKANDSIMSEYGIELKTEIEKIREQIQNIE